MIVNEAEQIYQIDKEQCERNLIQKKKKMRLISGIIGSLFFIIGIGLLIWSTTIEPTYLGEVRFENNLFQKYFGGASIFIAFVIVITFWINSYYVKVDYSFANKQLYLNYLRCSDVDDYVKDYYKELLKEIRSEELKKSINQHAAATGAAIMFTMIKRN